MKIQELETKGEPLSVSRARQSVDEGKMVCSSCYGRLEFNSHIPFDCERVKFPRPQPMQQCFMCESGYNRTLYKLKPLS